MLKMEHTVYFDTVFMFLYHISKILHHITKMTDYFKNILSH